MRLEDNIFFNYFPPPRLIEASVIGLDIADGFIRHLELHRIKYSHELRRFGSAAIPDWNINSDFGGGSDSIKKILSRLHKEHGFRYVRTALPQKRSFMVVLDLPPMKKSEIRGSIGLSLEEHVPLPSEDIEFDYRIIREDIKGGGLTVQVAAASKDFISEFLSLFEDTGIVPVVLETETQSIARSVIREGDLATMMVVHVGDLETRLFIASGGGVRFTTELEVARKGSAQKTDADEKVASQFASRIWEEIHKNFIYWHTHKDESGKEREKIERIILSGSGSTLDGLAEYGRAHSKVPVSHANPWINAVDFDISIPSLSRDESLSYAAAIGLALPPV
ncbi:pilus assembly protein PilM [bacterium]|nr:pilus assembly protein PilM [bacterium]